MKRLLFFVLLPIALACGGGGSSAPPADPALQGAADALTKKWEVDAGGWNKAIVLAPWGDVIALERAKLHVLAREDGRTLHTIETCAVNEAQAEFVDDHTLAIGCKEGGQRITFPAGTTADGDAPAEPSIEVDNFKAGSWVNDTAEVDGLFATAGSSGLLVFSPDGGKPLKELDGDGGIGVDGDEHGVCYGTTGGDVKCFAAGALPKSTYEAPGAGATAAVGGAFGSAASGPGGTHEGTIKSASGGNVVLSTTGGAAPTKGAKGKLSKQVNKKFGGMNITAWLDIAEVEVTAVSGSTVTCKVLRESTEIMVNGKKQNQFVTGAATKLTWSN